jgi:hypothetical protein
VWLAAGALLPFVGVLSFYAAQYVPFLSDDSLISLRYARRLLDGAGLTWTEGHRVEGYSNLLWILAVAFVGRLGVDLIDAARLLGLASTVTAMFALTWWNVRRPSFAQAWLPAVVGLSFLAFGRPMRSGPSAASNNRCSAHCSRSRSPCRFNCSIAAAPPMGQHAGCP